MLPLYGLSHCLSVCLSVCHVRALCIVHTTAPYGLRENAGHENVGQVEHNTTHRQFTRKVEFNDRQEHRNSNNIIITNLPMIQ